MSSLLLHCRIVSHETVARLGDAQKAVHELHSLFEGPSLLSCGLLRGDSRWDPIRDDPSFSRLLADYDGKHLVELNG